LGTTDRSLRSLLVGGSLGVAALHVASRALGVVTTLVLAALLGAAGYGTYAWAIACVAVLRIPAGAGRNWLLVREMARGPQRAVLRDSARAIAIASFVLVCAGLLVAPVLDARLGSALRVALVLLPLVAALGAAQGALQGLQRPVAALAPDALLRPVLFLALLGIVAAGSGANTALLLQTASTLAALLVTVWLVRRYLPPAAREQAPHASWNRSGLMMALNSGLGILSGRVDLILVGLMLGAADAGVYGVASAAASLAFIPVAAIAAPLSPTTARLHSRGEHPRLARAIAGATRWTFGVTLLGAAGLALVARFGLGLVGDAFQRGAEPLALLCVGAVINAAFAANNLALLMTGEERAATRTAAAGAAVTAAGAAALIPVWGLNGAATGVVVGTLLRNLLASRATRARLDLDTTLWSQPVEMAS
jgi:O-antigen/teichoic acid export membrane protein